MGRYVLPWFGGGPAVWTVCLLFFQVLLVAGYAYAHSMRFARAHIVVLALSLLALPLAPRRILFEQASSTHPSLHILLVLAATVAAPYFVLSATGPLVQRWFTIAQPGEPPWRLYALSNLGSFLALFTYPFAVEPFFTLRTQSWIWSGLYACFVALCAWTALTVGRELAPVRNSPVRPRAIFCWIGLAATGSTLLLATTNLISQDVAVIPFLWIAPLALYLLTFVIAFERDSWYRRTPYAIAAGLLVPAACIVNAAAVGISPWWQIVIYVSTLFVACMLCHGELARSRPNEQHLTHFYLAIAGGGALGGVFVAVIAPRIFTQFTEYPIGLALACIGGLWGWMQRGALRQWATSSFAVRIPTAALAVGAMSAVALISGDTRPALTTVRNFFGVLRVTEQQDATTGPYRELTHGRIRHGLQFLRSPQSSWPTTYYGPHSGVGIALEALEGPRRVGIIGLGAGTMAAWGRVGDTFRFYEINPAVISIAESWFSYLKNSSAKIETVLGDARVQLERERASGDPQRFDVLAVDAFSSDAIPLHLLTAQCGDLYRSHLKPNGLLLFHVSNRFLNLDPVTRGIAAHLGWSAARFVSSADSATGESNARWVLMTSDSTFLKRDHIALRISPWMPNEPAPILWTDDFASLWHVLK